VRIYFSGEIMAKIKGSVSLTAAELGKVKVLAGLGYSYRRIAREIGRSDHTVKRALKSPEIVGQVETIKKDLGDIFHDLAHRMIESISAEDIGKINAYQRTVSAAIATDKSQLLKGLPTMNVALLMQVAEHFRDQRDEVDEVQRQLPALPADLQ
jgi:predicted transcriptional regulator